MKHKIIFLICTFLTGHCSLWAQFHALDNNPLQQHSHQGINEGHIWGRDTTETKRREVPIGSFSWTIDERFGNVTPTDMDTLSLNFQNVNETAGMTGQYNTLGNLGAPRLSRRYMDRKSYSNFIFADPFDYFYTPIDKFLFTNTKSPITNLSYHACGNKQKGEDHLRAYFASNINKYAGIGLKFDYLYGKGYYNHQGTSLFNGSAYGYYRGDRYNMHAWISVNHMRLGENGGIEDDRYITHPEDFTRSYQSKDIPTNLSQYWNRNEDQTYYLNHRYNLGFEREKELPDSLKQQMPSDSTFLMALNDSLRRVVLSDETRRLAAIDSLQKEYLDTLYRPMEFVPVTSFIHTLKFRNAKHAVYSYNTPEKYYTNHYYGTLDNMRDRTRIFSVKNTVGIALREGFNKWAKAGLTAYASHEYRHHIIPDLRNGAVVEHGFAENNIAVGGLLDKRMGRVLHYDVTGEVVLAGEDLGQFEVEGHGDLNFKFLKDTMRLHANAYIKNLNPSFYMRHYHSQFAWWDHSLDKEFKTRIEGALSYEARRSRTRLTIGAENVKNYSHFAIEKTPYHNDKGEVQGYSRAVAVRQHTKNIQVFSAQLNQDFTFGIFHWDNEVLYQESSNEEVLPLPTLSAYSNLYITFRIAKVLHVQLGGDVRYFTSYYAPDYAPIVQQFALQAPEERVKIGNYPICNVYANMHLKHCRFYVSYNHVNENGGNAFLVPHYPINPRAFHFGLSWNFFN